MYLTQTPLDYRDVTDLKSGFIIEEIIDGIIGVNNPPNNLNNPNNSNNPFVFVQICSTGYDLMLRYVPFDKPYVTEKNHTVNITPSGGYMT